MSLGPALPDCTQPWALRQQLEKKGLSVPEAGAACLSFHFGCAVAQGGPFHAVQGDSSAGKQKEGSWVCRRGCHMPDSEGLST